MTSPDVNLRRRDLVVLYLDALPGACVVKTIGRQVAAGMRAIAGPLRR